MKNTGITSQENRLFLKLMMGITIPIALQNLITNALNMLDVFMIGQLGEIEIAGCGLANQVFFVYNLICFGVGSGASIFMSQCWGRGDIKSIHKTMGVAFIVCILLGALFTAGGFFMPEELLGIFSNDSAVIEVGASYLRVVCLSYILFGITTIYVFALRCVGKTGIPMLITLISFFCNAGANLVLIFGLFGFPKMGVVGAAAGTLFARIVEIILMHIIVYGRKMQISAPIKEYFSFDRAYVKVFFKTAGFVIINELMWSLGVSLYNSGYKYAGTQAQAAMQICSSIQNLFYVVSIGLGAAAAIMIGNLLGAGKIDQAKSYGNKFFIANIVTGAGLSFLFIGIRPFALSFFEIGGEVYEYAFKIMFVMACYLVIKCINHLIIVGLLRCGGDTLVCML
ncbi:MAG: MATE family efflux transporter, partial [Firmicutes bacterium]|nr:MATE family efflux transporter [Bacillota bacterium]